MPATTVRPARTVVDIVEIGPGQRIERKIDDAAGAVAHVVGPISGTNRYGPDGDAPHGERLAKIFVVALQDPWVAGSNTPTTPTVRVDAEARRRRAGAAEFALQHVVRENHRPTQIAQKVEHACGARGRGVMAR